MGSNVFFEDYNESQEQELADDLIVEAIEIYGKEMYYIPRTATSYDSMFGEDDAPRYDQALMIDMYIRNTESFQGDGDFLAKFGEEIRDRITFTVARRSFMEYVGNPLVISRPREGDLVYFPINNKIFQIVFVEHEATFYQMGALQSWDLICELFEYSNERFNTGIEYIDTIVNKLNFDKLAHDASNTAITIHVLDDNDYFQTTANTFIDFSEHNPFGNP